MIDLIRTQEIKDAIRNNPDNVLSIIEDEKNIGICITNNKGYYKAVNSRYAEIYGYKKSELEGKHFTVVVPSENQEYLSSLHEKFLRDEYELLRHWTVTDKNGNEMKIQADAGHFSNIFDNTDHKVTFVQIN